jgi:DNA-binding MarR family transcriptional regulator
VRITSAARQAWRDLAELWFSDELHDRFHDACAAIAISPPQFKALLSLEPGKVQAMRDLAEGWRCDASWVTGIVDGLELKGYVERQVNPTDRRIKVVVLTALGQKAKERALEVLHEPPESLSALTAVEQRTLRDLTAKVWATSRARTAAHRAEPADRT